MARSPFPTTAINAILTFKVPVVDSYLDDSGDSLADLGDGDSLLESGGGAPIVDDSGNLAIALTDWTAKVSARVNNKRPQPIPGGDLSQVRLTVTLIDPMDLPSSIQTGAQGEIVFYSDPGKLLVEERRGQFVLEPVVPRAYGVDAIVGRRLSGIFLSRVAWGNSL